MRTVGVGDRDLDAEGPGLDRCVAADVAHRAVDRLAIDQLDLGIVAELDVAQVALADLALGHDRIELEDGGHLGAGHDRAAGFHGDAVDQAVEWRLDLVAIQFGLHLLEFGLRGGQCRAGIVGLELGHAAGLDQPLHGLRLGLALHEHLPGHVDRGGLLLGVQHQDEIASFDMIALLDGQLFDDACDAAREHGALVCLGLAGNADGARMLDARRSDHRDGAQDRFRRSRLGGGLFRRVGGGAADRRELACRRPAHKAGKNEQRGNLVKPESRHLLPIRSACAP